MGRGDDYKFLPIADAIKALNQKVNLIGVVVETSIPKHTRGTGGGVVETSIPEALIEFKVNIIGGVVETSIPKYTRGTDCFCTIRIVDESNPSQGIPVNIFLENMGKLPLVESAGDIIQFSRVQMKIRGREAYALFNKSYSAFALFDGKCGTSYAPYQVSKKYQSRDQDKKLIDELRNWLSCNLLDGGTEQALSLKQIKFGPRLDVICKVLHACEVSDDNWIAFIWDGTDTPTSAIKYKLQDEMDKPIPLHLEPPLSRDVLCSFPTVGTILRVIVDQSNEKFDLKFLRAGRWILLSNIIFETEAGFPFAMLTTVTKIRLLSDDEPAITELQRNYDDRFLSKWGRMPLACFPYCSRVTETDHADVAFGTLMGILTHSEVTAKFRCVVRVVAVLPGRADQFRDPRGILRIRLTLDDPTARIHAYVYAEDGEMFFGENCTTDIMEKMRKKLLGVTNDDGEDMEDAPREPPWIACCIKSYYLDDNDKWGTRKYRIFGTRVRNSEL